MKILTSLSIMSYSMKARRWVPMLLILCATILPQIPSINYDFVYYDDYVSIINNPLVKSFSWSSLIEFFRPIVRPGLWEYMPLKNLSYAIDYSIFGMSARAFRPQQWVWYAIASIFLWSWLRRLLGELADKSILRLEADRIETVALLSVVFFVLHPAHVESVTWLSGRKDLMCGAFMFAALLFALKWPGGLRTHTGTLLLALLFTALALLSKPIASVLPLLFAAQDGIRYPSKEWYKLFKTRIYLYTISLVLVILFIAIYQEVVPGLKSTITEEGHYRIYHGPDWLRWGQQLGVFVKLSIVPFNLVPEYFPSLFDQNLMSWRGLGGLVLLVGYMVLIVVGFVRRWFFSLCQIIFAVPLIPIILTPAWDQYVAGRYLFLSIAGITVFLSWLFVSCMVVFPKIRHFTASVAVVMILFYSLLYFDYQRQWKNRYTLWTYAAQCHPEFIEFKLRAAKASRAMGLIPESHRWIQLCLLQDGEHPRCLAEYGSYLMNEDPSLAEKVLNKALPKDTTGTAALHLSHLLVKKGHVSEATSMYREWMRTHMVRPIHVKPMIGLALLDNNPQLALAATRKFLEAIVREDPTRPPPEKILHGVAQAQKNRIIAAKIEQALQKCEHSECFYTKMGWAY